MSGTETTPLLSDDSSPPPLQNRHFNRNNANNSTSGSRGEGDTLLDNEHSPPPLVSPDHRPSYGTRLEVPGHLRTPYSDSRSDIGEDGCDFDIKPDSVHVPRVTDHAFSWRRLWSFTGPGFLMSIAYLDPGNIESDLQSGAVAQYKLLWVLMWSTVMGFCLQRLAARLGCVTGMNLAEVCRQEYSTVPRICLWIMTEIAIIGSDIQEVVGSAIAISLLSNHTIPLWAGVLITGVDTFTFLFLETAGLRKLEAFFGALITTMAITFMYMYIMVTPDQLLILKGLAFPWCEDCDREAIKQMVGIVGAVIMPHNIYLHSALVLSRDIDRRDKGAIKEANLYNAIESALALFVSFLVNLFVVAVFAAAFSDIKFATLRLAGDWLYENYGLAMKIMWALGLLAAGQSSTMTGTYAGQFVMEGFLQIRWAKWKRVLLTRAISIVPTVIVASVMTAELDTMTQWMNILQSVQLPFALLPIMQFTNSERIMGEFKNSGCMRFTVGVIVVLTMGVNLYLVTLYVEPNLEWYWYLLLGEGLALYGLFLLYLIMGINNYLKLKRWVKAKCGCNAAVVTEEIERHRNLVYPRISEEREPLIQQGSTDDLLRIHASNGDLDINPRG
ncbi:metal transporter nramp1 homolog [Littorina saxatilis]|uniref:Uncharacterized protein n=1 Tax=Littorina saxatilis TaxID=31220 RepID=A0AAN9AU01_9CAEN